MTDEDELRRRIVELEAQLREAKESLEVLGTVFDASPIGLEIFDRDALLIRANPMIETLFGSPIGPQIGKYNLRDDPQASLPEIWERLEQGETLRNQSTYDPTLASFPTTRKGPVHLDVTIVPVGRAVSERVGFVVQLIDITEQRAAEAEAARLEEQLRQAQRMEAVGTLAGGVAHDFNNILGGLLSGLSVLDLEPGCNHAEIGEMKALVERGAELAKELLGFSRRGKGAVHPLDLADVVARTVGFFRRTHRDVSVDLDLQKDLPAVLMDHTQLEQALLNLLLNAAQAMPGGGRVRVGAAALTVDATKPALPDATPGRFVALTVSDTGVGMDAETQARIFEPFFTTKAPWHGSGLGLASVRGIVTSSGGAIDMTSEPGKGTTFTIHLPTTDLPLKPKPNAANAAIKGQGTILVVDDEEPLVRIYARMLRSMGYEPLTATSGKAGLDLLRSNRDKIGLVILDLTMPEMSGAETFDAMRTIAPDVKVLVSSGLAVDADSLLAKGCDGVLQKPFGMAALAAKLTDLL